MGWLNDLLKQYPALSVAKERLALIEEKLKATDAENKKLREENNILRQKVNALRKESQFIEFKGVLWKKSGESIDPLSYCPDCKLAMSEFPPDSDEMLTCSKCNFTAPFKPSQVETLAKKLDTELLLL